MGRCHSWERLRHGWSRLHRCRVVHGRGFRCRAWERTGHGGPRLRQISAWERMGHGGSRIFLMPCMGSEGTGGWGKVVLLLNCWLCGGLLICGVWVGSTHRGDGGGGVVVRCYCETLEFSWVKRSTASSTICTTVLACTCKQTLVVLYVSFFYR